MTVSLKAGDVISYPYLWRREADNGETEGRKTRPAVVVVPLELRRVGLTAEKRGWVTSVRLSATSSPLRL